MVLNLQSIPKESPIDLKVFLHEPGTVPDVLNLESSHVDIHENGWTKIGISITSNEATENFNTMSNEKRGCLNNNPGDNNRTQCLIDQVHQQAMVQCNCTLRHFKSQGFPICTITGSYCFRNATANFRLQKVVQLCPKPCTFKEYHTTRSIDIGVNPFDLGEEAVRFLASNPTNLILKNLTNQDYGYDGYIGKIWESYSLLQIHFDNPQMTVITKDAKVTLPDMVSSIGGTIGIFLGLSTLSMLDVIIHWFKVIQRKFNKKIG